MRTYEIENKIEMEADAHVVTCLVKAVRARYQARAESYVRAEAQDKRDKKEDSSLISSKLLHPVLVQTYSHFCGELSPAKLTKLLEVVGSGNEKAVRYHGERGELPQSFFLECLTTAMMNDLSKSYAALYVQLFAYLGYLKRTDCISGPSNSLAVSATDDLFKDMDAAFLEKRRFREKLLLEIQEEPVVYRKVALG